MELKTIKDIKDLKNKTVLLRVDFNVPIQDQTVQDDTRIRESLETINYLLNHEAKIIIMTHLGRPKGQVKEELRLDPIAKKFAEILKKDVNKLDHVIGKEVKNAVKSMQAGEVIMLENIRFQPEEEKNDKEFCKELAELADIYVNDAFATAHRAHASTAGVAELLPSYAGFLMEREVNSLAPVLEDDIPRPVTMILGGAKIDTKIGMIKNFFDKVDYFLVGGGLANTFLQAAGYNVANSLYQKDKIEVAQEIMLECEKHREKFILPHDVVIASEVSDDVETIDLPVEDVMGDMRILDIGKWTAEKFANIVSESGTVIWNGPLGVCEFKNFQNGTKIVAHALAETNCMSIIGGGDTLDALQRINVPHEPFTHISTGGGACIEFLEGKELPGIKALLKK